MICLEVRNENGSENNNKRGISECSLNTSYCRWCLDSARGRIPLGNRHSGSSTSQLCQFYIATRLYWKPGQSRVRICQCNRNIRPHLRHYRPIVICNATFHASSTTNMGHTHTGVQHPKLLRLRRLHRRSSLGNNRWRNDPQMETTSTTSNNNIPIGRTGKSLEDKSDPARGCSEHLERGEVS